MDEVIKEIIKHTKTIAVIGMSDSAWKPAHYVPMYMLEKGYNIIPINPKYENIEGLKCFPDLYQPKEAIELVIMFRPSNFGPAYLKEAIERSNKFGDVKYFWMPLGIKNELCEGIIQDSSLKYLIQDKCLMVEHQRLISG